MDPRSLTGGGTAVLDGRTVEVQATPVDKAVVPRRPRHRPEPERDAQFGHLSLLDLRAYRKTLSTEEAQVSYWRRVLQARLDVVRAGALGTVDGAKLRPLLTDARLAHSRMAVVDIVPVADIPPLPSLAELWDRQVDPADHAAMQRLEADLTTAEVQISAYRKALHARIDEATNELIARYRETPSLCLDVLPLPPQRPTR